MEFELHLSPPISPRERRYACQITNNYSYKRQIVELVVKDLEHLIWELPNKGSGNIQGSIKGTDPGIYSYPGAPIVPGCADPTYPDFLHPQIPGVWGRNVFLRASLPTSMLPEGLGFVPRTIGRRTASIVVNSMLTLWSAMLRRLR